MVIVLIVSFVFEFFRIYEAVYELDSVVHFFGGVASAMTAARLALWAEGVYNFPVIRGWPRVILGVAMVGCVALLWEVYEFTVSILFTVAMQPSLADTMVDMIVGTTGGLLWFAGNEFLLQHRSAVRTPLSSPRAPEFADVIVDVQRDH